MFSGCVSAAGGKTSLTLLRPCVSWQRRKTAKAEDHDGKKKKKAQVVWRRNRLIGRHLKPLLIRLSCSQELFSSCGLKEKLFKLENSMKKKNWKLQLCDEEPSMEFHQPVLMQVFQSEAMKKIPKFPISPSNKRKKPIGFPRSSFLFFLFCPLT